MRKAIAIDFDGCLCENAWPEIGAPNMDVINAARQEKEKGSALILWTCRAGERLGEAVAWCAGFGLVFDAVNANLPERIEHYQTESRKVSADEYWDDAAVVMGRETEAHSREETQEIRERMLRDAVLRDAVKTWGMEAQQRMMIEEMSELIKHAGSDEGHVRGAGRTGEKENLPPEEAAGSGTREGRSGRMSDRIRKALYDDGKIDITIEYVRPGSIEYCVHEQALRLDGFERGEITKDALDAAADPDALIEQEISKAVRENHIAWEARKE